MGLRGPNSVLRKRLNDFFREHPDETIDVERLLNAAYGESEDGGPLWAESSLRATICKMRRAGFEIETVRGYRLNRRPKM